MTYDAAAAAADLAAMDASRARLADKVRCPPHLHALFGLIMGGLIAGQAAPTSGAYVVDGLCILAALWMYFEGRRRMGFFVNGYRKGRTRPVMFAMLAAYISLFVGSVLLKEQHAVTWAPLAAGALMFAVGVWASFKWQAVYRAELMSADGSARA